MAMRNLVEGGECGQNSLLQTVDHFSRIKDHRELLHHEQYLQGAVGGVPNSLAGDGVFRMDTLLNDMERVQERSQSSSIQRPMLNSRHINVQNVPIQFANEFSPMTQQSRPSLLVDQRPSTSSSMTQQYYSRQFMPPPMMMPHQAPLFQHPIHVIQDNQLSTESGLQLPQPFLKEQEQKLREESQKRQESKTQAESFVEGVKEFEKQLDKGSTDAQKLESQVIEGDDDLAFWNNLAEEWHEMSKDTTNDAYSFLGDNNQSSSEPFADGYYFKDDNPLLETPNAFEEGKKKLLEGDIPSAVLLFEAAAQQEPTRAEVWQYLGTTQAKNEHDPAAIRALKKALELDPSNRDCMMALAVSYTNESYQRQACDNLAQWILSNPNYSAIAHQVGVQESFLKSSSEARPWVVSSVISSTFFNQVKEAYIKSARLSPSGANLDPDVQCGLGVLLNLSGEYDKAADCFRAALSARPEDALLWNRLGATLANGSRSEEAVSAYTRALEISPGFIRSRFNLGISCINLNAYQEAVEHFLVVLNLQNAGRGPKGETSRTAMSNNVWSSLRMALSLMNRQDLYDSVEAKDLTRLNREFNMDISGKL